MYATALISHLIVPTLAALDGHPKTGAIVNSHRHWTHEPAVSANSWVQSHAGSGAFGPAISLRGDRLAFSLLQRDVNIWRADLDSGDRLAGTPRRFIASTRDEQNPTYSPDGQRIAFESQRSGTWEISVCRSDGTGAMQLTSFGGPFTSTPRWSPDGRWIAFQSAVSGNRDVYVVRTEGGMHRRLTSDSAAERVVGWCRDGRHVYVNRRTQSGTAIWKVPLEKGEPVRLADDVEQLSESPDGRFYYYIRPAARLFRVPVRDGRFGVPEEELPFRVLRNLYVPLETGSIS